MAFIRIKSFKKSKGIYDYAYLVSSKYRKRRRKDWTSRIEQKNIKYLGKVFNFEEIFEYTFNDFFESVNLSDIIGLELIKKGFVCCDGRYIFENIVVDLEKGFVCCDGRDCVLKINKGFLCAYTLSEILRFSKIKSREEGLIFLNKLMRCGVHPDADIFRKLIEKMI